jgi:hypothetical protein
MEKYRNYHLDDNEFQHLTQYIAERICPDAVFIPSKSQIIPDSGESTILNLANILEASKSVSKEFVDSHAIGPILLVNY